MLSSNTIRISLRQSLQASRHTRTSVKPSFRKYSTEVPKSSNTPIYLGVGAAVAAGVGYWVLTSSSPTAKEASTAVKSGAQIVKAKTNIVPKKEDYQMVYNRIAELLDEAENYDDGSYGPLLVRLAWHASGTYDKESKTGGSNYASMRFEPEALHGANNGLVIGRQLMDKVKSEFSWISYGDLWTLGGVAAIQEMAGPKIPWRPGRIDGFAKDATPDGRLPDATQGSSHLRDIFYRMGFNDQEIVALSGAHALGRCHTDRSGFEGPWTFSPTTLTNEYYKLLFDEKWSWRKWDGPKQLADKTTGTLMMLPTDYVLVQDKSFRKFAKSYAEDQNKFFEDFSAAFGRLLELGVPAAQFEQAQPWFMLTSDEQKK